MKRNCIFWNVQRFFNRQGRSVAKSLGGVGKGWTKEVYERKLLNVAEVLKRGLPDGPPAFIALAEVESIEVLTDLRDALGWHELRASDELFPDSTIDGLDVGILMDRTVFDLNTLRARSISLDHRFSTRDLLQLEVALIQGGQDVAIFLAHWPSRLISEGETLRFAYSVNLRRRINNVLQFGKAELIDEEGTVLLPDAQTLTKRWLTPCVVMGDFNDEPFDLSVRSALGSTRFRDFTMRRGNLVGKSLTDIDNYLDEAFTLYNPCWALRFSDNEEVGGTFYRTEWRSYDQVMFSHGALLEDAPARYIEGSARVLRLPEFNTNDKVVEMATSMAGAPRKFGSSDLTGVSDHFPLLFEMEFPTGR